MANLSNTRKYYDNIVRKNSNMKKSDLLAYLLSLIMQNNNIDQETYIIIASYCLKDYREVTDIDVIATPESYQILREKLIKNKIGVIGIGKISNDERIIIDFSNIAEGAEIEIYKNEEDIGFPTNNFSFKNLRKSNSLKKDSYGNNYFNLDMCIELYSTVKKINNEYYVGKFKINKERIEKNIGQLQQILTHNPNKKFFIKQKITYLKNLI